MRVQSGRPKAVFAASIAAVILVGALGVGSALAANPPGQARFLWALGKVESGGDYFARNSTTGAYGKYQIMPASWRAWANRYLGDPNARPTPSNQEMVASGKTRSLYRGLDRWSRVAYWWLTGSSQTTGWSGAATNYVGRVMDLYRSRAGQSPGTPIHVRHLYSERSPRITYVGRWRSAAYGGYAGGAVAYATAPGATATFTFLGTRIIWYGPVGPTRGRARVFVDGTLIKVVDLHASSFRASRSLFTRRWSTAGQHTLTIEVVGTPGRPYVAIDRLAVLD